jgi:hypothetical protein
MDVSAIIGAVFIFGQQISVAALVENGPSWFELSVAVDLL